MLLPVNSHSQQSPHPTRLQSSTGESDVRHPSEETSSESSQVGDDSEPLLKNETKEENNLINVLSLDAHLERYSRLYTSVVRDPLTPCTKEELALHLDQKDLSDHQLQKPANIFLAFVSFIVNTFIAWNNLSPKLSQEEKNRLWNFAWVH